MIEGNLHGFTPSCSVVICTRDRPEWLNRCLDSVSRLTYPKFDVLVVDNAPKDVQSCEIAIRWGVRYVVESEPGLSRARNRGVRACTAELIAFLDDDSMPELEWLTALVVEFNDPEVMAVTGRICPLNAKTEDDQVGAWIGGLDLCGQERRTADRGTPLWFGLSNFGGIGDGGNMAFRRQAFDVVPGFDERLGRGVILNGGEEHYAFFSLIDRGYRIIYTPFAIVRHPFPTGLKELRARHFKAKAASTGYLTLLFVEQPEYRCAVVRYAFEALLGIPRPWHQQQRKHRPRIISPLKIILAYLLGPLLYVWTRLVHRDGHREIASVASNGLSSRTEMLD